ncbi:MAG: CHASE2 domain-containing protein [Candidatus Nanoarchaeia archaeon]
MTKLLKCIGIALACAVVLSLLFNVGFFSNIQLRLSDNLYGGKSPLNTIVIAAIDDKSLQELGRFPWDRSLYTRILPFLNQSKVMAFDVAFFESSDPETDLELGNALRNANAIIPVEFIKFERQDGKIVGTELLKPIPALKNVAIGYVNVITDRDGITRAVNMQLSDKYQPLAHEMYKAYWKKETQSASRFLVNFVGGPNTFKQYSFTDILNGRIPPETFKNKLVLIGATSPGLHDDYFVPTSRGKAMPGVEIHANTLQTMINQDFLYAQSTTSVVLMVLILSLLTSLLVHRLKVLHSALIVIAALFVILFVAIRVFEYGILLNIVYACGAILVTYIAGILYSYFSERKEKKKLRTTLHKYVSRAVVDEVMKNPDKLKLGGERREITIFFSDVRGFTTISEKLSPEKLVHLLNEYLSAMTDIILEHEGVVDKYIGDAIMAFWGAPLKQPNHAELAASTTLDMLKKLNILQKQWEREGFPVLNIGCGLNTGPAVIGNMGSYKRFDYTAMGDSINLGARLEGITKQYGVECIISKSTKKQLKNFVVRELDCIIVKGKKEPIKIFELVCRKTELTDDLYEFIAHYETGLNYYITQKWDQAIDEFKKANKLKKDYASEVFIERCKTFKKSPPPKDWNGVWEFKTK